MAPRRYGKLPPGLTGTITLVDKLTLVLCHHIRQFLPQIKREVSERVRKCEDRSAEAQVREWRFSQLQSTRRSSGWWVIRCFPQVRHHLFLC